MGERVLVDVKRVLVEAVAGSVLIVFGIDANISFKVVFIAGLGLFFAGALFLPDGAFSWQVS